MSRGKNSIPYLHMEMWFSGHGGNGLMIGQGDLNYRITES